MAKINNRLKNNIKTNLSTKINKDKQILLYSGNSKYSRRKALKTQE